MNKTRIEDLQGVSSHSEAPCRSLKVQSTSYEVRNSKYEIRNKKYEVGKRNIDAGIVPLRGL